MLTTHETYASTYGTVFINIYKKTLETMIFPLNAFQIVVINKDRLTRKVNL